MKTYKDFTNNIDTNTEDDDENVVAGYASIGHYKDINTKADDPNDSPEDNPDNLKAGYFSIGNRPDVNTDKPDLFNPK